MGARSLFVKIISFVSLWHILHTGKTFEREAALMSNKEIRPKEPGYKRTVYVIEFFEIYGKHHTH